MIPSHPLEQPETEGERAGVRKALRTTTSRVDDAFDGLIHRALAVAIG